MSLQKFLDDASMAYYAGTPIISDEEFDRLAELANYNMVGHKIEGGIKHPFPLYSLQKFYVGESEPRIKLDLIESPKLDGAAVNLIYIMGKLTAILTRGDGVTGKDISHLISVFPDVPRTIDTTEEVVQVTGEVVADKSIENSRNYASGALGLKSVGEFRDRDLNFIAYGVQPYTATYYTLDMNYLSIQGFITILDGDYDFSIFPQDGKVFRVNTNAAFETLGYTDSHPRGAYALKERKVGIVTKLVDVIWQVGKTGAVSPVAILEPVNIGGAIVSRATLHNIAYIRDLDLEIGCDVEVIRAGEIIPRVIKRVA